MLEDINNLFKKIFSNEETLVFSLLLLSAFLVLFFLGGILTPFLISIVFNPSTFTSPTSLSSGKSPSSESACVHKLSACALAVAVPHDLVTLPLPNAYDSLVLIYHFSSLKFVLSVSTSYIPIRIL